MTGGDAGLLDAEDGGGQGNEDDRHQYPQDRPEQVAAAARGVAVNEKAGKIDQQQTAADLQQAFDTGRPAVFLLRQ